MSKLPISIIILTYNEEPNISDCLQSVADWADEVFVVDSGSTDRTLSIVAQYGAVQSIEHPFETHTLQWKWALEHLPNTHEWIFGLDADQSVTPELKAELTTLFAEYDKLRNIDGIYVKRRTIFRDYWLRHGGLYPKYLLKLFRHDKVQIDEYDLVDHHFYVAGNVVRIQHDILEYNKKENDIAFWIDKHNRYAVRHAREEFLRRHAQAHWLLKPKLLGSPDQIVIWLKQRWYGLPLYVRPVIYFLYRYVLRVGFLDGKQGFIFHVLQGFWYRLIVDIHLDELQKNHAQLSATCRHENVKT